MRSLLPLESASGTEVAVSEAVAEWWADVDPAIISTIWNPDTCPAQVLPYLANAFDVPVWRPEWPEETKREVIKTTIRALRLRGTERGFAMAARMAGSELLKTFFPPNDFFAGPSLTADELEGFVRRYPELRVYEFRSNGPKGFAFYVGDRFLPDEDGETTSFPITDEAAAIYGKQSYFYRDGVETWLRTIVREEITKTGEAVEYVEVKRPTKAVGLFVDGYLHGYLDDADAGEFIYRMKITQRYTASEDRVWYSTITPGLETLGYQAEPVRETGPRGPDFYANGSYVGDFLVETDASTMIYSRTWLFDPDIAVPERVNTSYVGYARLGMPAFNAELVVKVQDRIPLDQSFQYLFGYLVDPDLTKYHETIEALKWAKLGRDKILIRTQTVEPAKAGRNQLAGSLKAGDLQEIY